MGGRLIVIVVCSGRNPCWNDIVLPAFNFAVLIGLEGNLIDHGILLVGVLVASEAKITQRVGDWLALVVFNSLDDMRVMTDHQVCTSTKRMTPTKTRLPMLCFFLISVFKASL